MTQQRRATFEDVSKAQDKLDALIEQFITQNKPLTNNERKNFTRYFRLATMGLAGEYSFFLKGEHGTHNLLTAGKAARWLSKRKTNPVQLYNPTETMILSDCWKQLWDTLDKIYDPALEMSIKISQEQTHRGSSEPALV